MSSTQGIPAEVRFRLGDLTEFCVVTRPLDQKKYLVAVNTILGSEWTARALECTLCLEKEITIFFGDHPEHAMCHPCAVIHHQEALRNHREHKCPTCNTLIETVQGRPNPNDGRAARAANVAQLDQVFEDEQHGLRSFLETLSGTGVGFFAQYFVMNQLTQDRGDLSSLQAITLPLISLSSIREMRRIADRIRPPVGSLFFDGMCIGSGIAPGARLAQLVHIATSSIFQGWIERPLLNQLTLCTHAELSVRAVNGALSDRGQEGEPPRYHSWSWAIKNALLGAAIGVAYQGYISTSTEVNGENQSEIAAHLGNTILVISIWAAFRTEAWSYMKEAFRP